MHWWPGDDGNDDDQPAKQERDDKDLGDEIGTRVGEGHDEVEDETR
ncbi:MAG: hypothetical protein PHI23_03725 [Candidatus Peribacteraceae bacterium]|nr:hypothetical protein [Candidatus Peribacteraceae bacterium]